MTIVQAIKSICDKVAGYSFEFEEAKLMNVKADNKPFPCIYFEEYRGGSYTTVYVLKKVTTVELYFMKLAPVDSDAMAREELRESIEEESIKLFITEYNKSGLFGEVKEWKFLTPPPKFDANEVSIILQFSCVLTA